MSVKTNELPQAAAMADNDSFVATTSQGTKRMSLSLLKQIMGQIFAPAPVASTTVLYVNADSGSDSSDGKSAEHAKKTLAAALATLPKDLGGKSVTINLSGTFDELVNIQDFCHGDLTLQGEEGAHGRFTNAGTIYSNDVLLTINNVDFSGTASSHVLIICDNKSVVIENSVMDATAGGNGPMMRRNGYVFFNNCSISNASRDALLVNSGVVSVLNLSGSSNNTGVKCGNSYYRETGIVIANGLTISASVQFQSEQGGVIFNDGKLYGGE